MFRFAILLWPAAIAAVAIGLFQVKYSVQEIDRQILKADQVLDDLRAHHDVLSTEWAFQTQPKELKRLAASYLSLDADKGTLVTSLQGLPDYQAGAIPAAPWNSQFQSEQLLEAPKPLDDQALSQTEVSSDLIGDLLTDMEAVQ